MRKSAYLIGPVPLFLGLFVVLTAVGRDAPRAGGAAQPDTPTLPGSRDTFGPGGGVQPRLSRAELEQATRADRDEEGPPPAAAAATGAPRSGAPPLMAHRFSRDSTL